MARKYFWVVFALLVLALAASVPILSAQDNVDVYGRALPDDAAPYELQVWTALCNSSRTELSLASAVTVYSRVCDQASFDKFGDSLVVLDENLNTIPAAAENSARASGTSSSAWWTDPRLL